MFRAVRRWLFPVGLVIVAAVLVEVGHSDSASPPVVEAQPAATRKAPASEQEAAEQLLEKTLQRKKPVPTKWVRHNPQERTLFATMWMRHSAEYRAICLQTYNAAIDKVREGVRKLRFSQGRLTGTKPPAVVMDLDETVLDNTAFQARLVVMKQAFDDETFEKWLRDHQHEVRLIPGTANFIKEVEELDVTIVFISNRPDSHRQETIETLGKLGINIDGVEARLLLRTQDRDKEARRAQVREQYQILAILGDNLHDFSTEFSAKGLEGDPKALEKRLELVDKNDERWGEEWFVFPNPIYGDWANLVDWGESDTLLQP
ncbi:Lipoprotein E precursor [Planctomycetes bacterium Pan216]|uniref:Lipoprotein E n=1 Tax=Kolteria novifilia TaxID=2527975 RepID=A0A518BCP7_9BACT|nr:Lipoprotein E precursor [Planctomycetes bacterium Pan216]